jgi:FkbM family methyltransferase
MFLLKKLGSKFIRGGQLLAGHLRCLNFVNLSFSQEGEDLVLHRHFNYKPKGFYIDIGAHHPYRFSNTFKFYLKGWRGINIDPLPGSMKLFKRKRPEDINLEVAIAKTDGQVLNYYMFNEPTLNTFDQSLISRAEEANYVLQKTVPIKTYRLSTILEQHVGANQAIDFMSIDVEGFDLDVLQSNDWDKFRPSFLVVESTATDLSR